MQASLVAEKLDKDGNPRKTRTQNNRARKVKKAKVTRESHQMLSDDQVIDADYTDTGVSACSDSLTVSDEEEDVMVITNEEVQNYKL